MVIGMPFDHAVKYDLTLGYCGFYASKELNSIDDIIMFDSNESPMVALVGKEKDDFKS